MNLGDEEEKGPTLSAQVGFTSKNSIAPKRISITVDLSSSESDESEEEPDDEEPFSLPVPKKVPIAEPRASSRLRSAPQRFGFH
jgi:hypothetical protein